MSMIQYLPFQSAYLDGMTEIIYQVWDMERLCGSAELGRVMAAKYLCGCFEESTFIMTAVKDGSPVGLILARAEGAEPLQAPLEWKGSLGRYSCQKKDLARVKQYDENLSQYQMACKTLMESCAEFFGGEITLFSVSPRMQGMGIGTQLFQLARRYLSSFQCSQYFLYTDSTCTYAFYDAHGLKRIREGTMDSPLTGQSLRLFLYQGMA